MLCLQAFLDSGMGLTALIRNLNRFMELDIFAPASAASVTAAERHMAGLSVEQAEQMEAKAPSDSKYVDLVCKRCAPNLPQGAL